MEMMFFIALLMGVAGFGHLYLARANRMARQQTRSVDSSSKGTDVGLDLMSMLGGIHEFVESGAGRHDVISVARDSWPARRVELMSLEYSDTLLDDIESHLHLADTYDTVLSSSFADASGDSEAAASAIARQISQRSPVLVGRISLHLGSIPSSHPSLDTEVVGAQ